MLPTKTLPNLRQQPLLPVVAINPSKRLAPLALILALVIAEAHAVFQQAQSEQEIATLRESLERSEQQYRSLNNAVSVVDPADPRILLVAGCNSPKFDEVLRSTSLYLDAVRIAQKGMPK